MFTSEYVLPAFFFGSRTTPKGEVITTLLTAGAFSLIAFKIPVEPIRTELIRHSLCDRGEGSLTWSEHFIVRGCDILMLCNPRFKSMDNSLEGGIGDDGFVEG